MATPRVFLNPSPGDSALPIEWSLDARESHHLSHVLRLREGDAVCGMDGQGGIWQGVLLRVGRRECLLQLQSVYRAPVLKPERILIQALPKQKAWETILRMAAEIGVNRIVPVISAHCEVRLEDKKSKTKLEKWQQLLIEACKQCGLPWLPVIEQPLPLKQWLESQRTPLTGCIASLEAGAAPLISSQLTLDSHNPRVYAAVGPEGDFSSTEYHSLRECGLLPVRLGQQTLRCDTAAAYLLSVLDQRLGVAQC